MKVGLCHTKPTPIGRHVVEMWRHGVVRCGDKPVEIWNVKHLPEKVAECDVLFQVCGTKDVSEADSISQLRKGVRDAARQYGKRTLILDAGFVRNEQQCVASGKATAFRANDPHTFAAVADCIHYEIGYDGIKRHADYCNENSPADRWNALNVEMQPWRTGGGEHVLLIGQTENGISSQHVSIREWYAAAVVPIARRYGLPVVMRHHPRVFKTDSLRRQEERLFATSMPADVPWRPSTHLRLEDDLRGAAVAVVYSSNAAVSCVLAGVPTICGADVCMAWDVRTIDGEPLPDRTQWACDLGYAQWNFRDMQSGAAWSHFRPFATL